MSSVLLHSSDKHAPSKTRMPQSKGKKTRLICFYIASVQYLCVWLSVKLYRKVTLVLSFESCLLKRIYHSHFHDFLYSGISSHDLQLKILAHVSLRCPLDEPNLHWLVSFCKLPLCSTHLSLNMPADNPWNNLSNKCYRKDGCLWACAI